jgi:hypothetical protein
MAQPTNERTPHTQQQLEDSVASAHAQAAALRAAAAADADAAQLALEEAAAAATDHERRVGHVTRSLPPLLAAISRTGCNAAAKARVFGVAQRTGTGTGANTGTGTGTSTGTSTKGDTKGDTKGEDEDDDECAGAGAAVAVPEEKVPVAATELGLGPGVAAALVQQQVRHDTWQALTQPVASNKQASIYGQLPV